ncbi:MAG: thiol:disulfide interchange protein [Chitinophagales bacterium]|jgi:thiol:disulfide interchange protein
MKNLILVFSFIVLGSHLSAQGLFNNMSYDEVLKTAKAEKKPYYVDITATWCLPCKMMDETVFQDKLVQQYTAENYLAVQLDVEDFNALILKSEYQVKSLPTILFFNYKGNLVGRSEGLQTGTNFLKILKQYI